MSKSILVFFIWAENTTTNTAIKYERTYWICKKKIEILKGAVIVWKLSKKTSSSCEYYWIKDFCRFFRRFHFTFLKSIGNIVGRSPLREFPHAPHTKIFHKDNYFTIISHFAWAEQRNSILIALSEFKNNYLENPKITTKIGKACHDKYMKKSGLLKVGGSCLGFKRLDNNELSPSEDTTNEKIGFGIKIIQSPILFRPWKRDSNSYQGTKNGWRTHWKA